MSFRVPGSMLDQMYPSAVVEDKYFLGSGSSQSAAVVSGFTAAMLSKDPTLSPDEIKYLFMSNTEDLEDAPATVDGNGKILPKEVARNVDEAESAPVQTWMPALPTSGPGLLAPNGGTWSGGTWSGGTWSSATWSGGTWSGATWSSATWSGGTWSGSTWSGGTWSGATWSGGTWSGEAWSTNSFE